MLERQQEVEPPEPPPIYRSVECSIGEPIVAEMANKEKHLRELAIEDAWKVDWAKFQKQRTAAENAHKAADYPEAFRAYCRTLSLPCAGMRDRREKQEVFRPQWERKQAQ